MIKASWIRDLKKVSHIRSIGGQKIRLRGMYTGVSTKQLKTHYENHVKSKVYKGDFLGWLNHHGISQGKVK